MFMVHMMRMLPWSIKTFCQGFETISVSKNVCNKKQTMPVMSLAVILDSLSLSISSSGGFRKANMFMKWTNTNYIFVWCNDLVLNEYIRLKLTSPHNTPLITMIIYSRGYSFQKLGHTLREKTTANIDTLKVFHIRRFVNFWSSNILLSN